MSTDENRTITAGGKERGKESRQAEEPRTDDREMFH